MSDAKLQPPISDYALIGDCHSVALVSRGGSIDWACLRHFDNSPVFAELLDPNGGSFRILAADVTSISRRYVDDTNVLETTFVCKGGTLRLRDAFAMRAGGDRNPFHQLLREIECVAGVVEVEVQVEPRFDYCTLHPWLRQEEPSGVFTAVGGDDALIIWTDAAMVIDREAVCLCAKVQLRKGERRRFAVTAAPPEQLTPVGLKPEDFDQRMVETLEWWTTWTARGAYPERYRDVVVRSSLLLKLLTCGPTGAIVAAPTTSLPEWIGGTRNWDYRYAWVRDASMAMAALVSVGHDEVAQGLRRFLERASAGSASELQIMYGSHGERRLVETELTHLAGYRGSAPVRIGNAAHDQLQLDVYGELLTAIWIGQKADPVDRDTWRFIHSIVDEACRRWPEADRGIWESRAAPAHYVHSKVMCWVALDIGLKLAAANGFEGDVALWTRTRDEIRAWVDTHGVDPKRGCFVQASGSVDVDASLLRMALVGFVPADDPRFVATVAAVEKDLRDGDLVRRYLPANVDDGFKSEEGMFLLCAFWLVDVMAMQGRLDEARKLFESLIGRANDVGLLPEQIDPVSGDFLGNFPQAFSHMAIINAAQQLQSSRPPEERALPIGERPQT